MASDQPEPRARLNPVAAWDQLNRLNMEQNELARAVGVTTGYLSQLMTGTRHPSAAVRTRLVEALGIDDRELFVLEEDD